MTSEHRLSRCLPAVLVSASLALSCAWCLPMARADRVPAADVSAASRAAMLYHFALYTTWPLPAPDAITLCTTGHDGMGSAFDALATRQVNGRPVQAKRIGSVAEARSCQVLYVRDSGGARVDALMRGLASYPVLIVSESSSLDASMVLLETEGNRLGFSINLTRVRSAGLELNTKLLRLARSVK